MVNQLDPAILAFLIETIAATWPPDTSTPDRRALALAALQALDPHDLMEGMLASRMIAAHFASMEGFRRAMQPGLGDADATRLRANAIAAGRSFDAGMRVLTKRHAPAPTARVPRPAARQQRPTEDPAPEQALLVGFTPEEIAAAEYALDNDPAELARQDLAQRIPLHRWEDMTMDERHTAYAPRAPMTPAQIAVLGVRLAEQNRRPLPASIG